MPLIGLEKNQTERILFYSTVFLLLLYYLYLSWHYTINYPLTEDVFVIALEDITQYATDADYGLLDYLFQKKNNHPILFLRFHAISSYLLTGNVDLQLAVLHGNFFYLGLIIAFTCLFKNHFHRIILLLILGIPVAHIFVNLSTNSAYYLPVLFFYFATRLLSRPRPLVVMSILIPFLLVLMVYSFGNGFLGTGLLTVYVFYLKWKKDISIPVFWLTIISSLLIGGYYIGTFELNTEPIDTFQDSWEGKIHTLIFPFSFCGSYIKAIFGESSQAGLKIILTTFTGLLFLIFAAFTIIKKLNKDNLAIGLSLLLIFMSGVLTAYGRCASIMFCTPLTWRYEQYGLLFISFIYLLSINVEAKKMKYFLTGLVVIISCANLYQNNIDFKWLFYINNEKRTFFLQKGKIDYAIFYKKSDVCNDILKNAIDAGIYDVKESLYKTTLIKKSSHHELKHLNKKQVKIKTVEQKNGLLHLRGRLNKKVEKADIFVCIKEDCFRLNYWVKPSKTNKTNFVPFYSVTGLPTNQKIKNIKNKLYFSD